MRFIQIAIILALFCGATMPPCSSQAPVADPDPAVLAKATAGDAVSQVAIADAFAEGNKIAQDYKQAAAWYRKAAEQGNIAGQIGIAALYRDGKGVPRDPAQAAQWYRKAADQGDAGAQGTLATLYVYGQGVSRDDVEAYYWFDLAASVKSPKQEQFAANRQNIGTRITVDELADVQERAAKWKAAHPR